MTVAPGLLLAYQGEAGADVLEFGRRWVRASAEPLTVVTIYPAPAPLGAGRVDAEWIAYGRDEAHRLQAEARSGLGPELAVDYRTVASDSASHGLHDVAEDSPVGSIVVLGSRRSRGGRRTSTGSTADRLLHGSVAPVAVVPWDYESSEPGNLARVAVAYVDTPDGRAALAGAGTIAQRIGAALEIVSIVPDTRVFPSLGDIRRFRDEQRGDYTSALTAALELVPDGVTATTRLIDGPVVDALADLTSDTADLLVCGSRGYGPARRVLLGGVSSRVLNSARVPVLVIPRG